MKSRGKTQPTPVGEIVKKLLENFNLENRVSREGIYQLWPQVVGEPLARHSWPTAVKGKTLIIGVDDSLWMQRLSLMRLEIMEGIARELGPGHFNDLRLVMGQKPQN